MIAAPIAAALVVAGCGGGDGGAPTEGLPAAAARGAEVAETYQCASCHSVNGSERRGPTWLGIWGEQVELTDGRTVTVDEAYVRRSVEEPGADVVDGFGAIMPRFDLDDDELAALSAYIESLGSAP
jgi:cytochrome c oxidase subunit 2